MADDPVYIDNMHRFFAVQAANVAYETYFNADPPDGEHALCPGAPFPRALATYKAAWGGGSRRPRRRNPRPCRGVGRASSSRRVGRTVSLGLALAASAAPAYAGTTERASVGPGGAQADGRSSGVALSPDGRYVAFASFATNLAPGSTNGRHNIYLRDRSAGATERVSVGPGGTAGNDSSFDAAVSADGLLVAFGSYATNLVPGDDNMRPDIFARDRGAGATERANVAPDGAQANDDSDSPSLSADGRFLAFRSAATNLVAGDTNLYGDVFVRDRRAGKTERVSVSSGGAEGNANSYRPVISADGQFVAFVSDATNLVPGDTNGHADVFVRDLAAGRTERVSLGPGGAQGNGDSGYVGLAISGDGRLVAFVSDASNLVPGDTNGRADVFVRDRQAGATERVSLGPGGVQGDGNSGYAGLAISGDGHVVAFASDATNLVPGDTNGRTDVFARDRAAGTTERVSVGPGDAQGKGASYRPAISWDGREVAFVSEAANLVPGDTNGVTDVFVRSR